MNNTFKLFLKECEMAGIKSVAINDVIPELIIDIMQTRKDFVDAKSFYYKFFGLQAYPYRDAHGDDIGHKISEIASRFNGFKVGCGVYCAFQFWQHDAEEKLPKGVYDLVDGVWYKRMKERLSI
jgi:hypothetical protein